MQAAFWYGAAFLLPPALLAGWGLLIGRFLLTRGAAAFLPWLAPALGLALIASVGPAAGTAGIPLHFISWPMVLLAGLGWILTLKAGGWSGWIRAHWLVLAVAGGAFLLAATPLLILGHLTTVGSSIDAISYNVRSEYVQVNVLRVPEVLPGKPYLSWVASQIGFLRVGDIYWLGLVSWVLRRRSFEMLTVLAALAHATTAYGTYFFTRAGLGLRRSPAILAATFVAIHNALIWPALDCSFSQVVALGLIPTTLGLGAVLMRRPTVRLAIAVGCLLSALAAIYPVYLVVELATLGVLGLMAIARFPIPKRRWARLRAGAIVAFTALAANPVAWLRALSELGFLGGMLGAKGVAAVGRGNILVFPPVAELFGLISHAAAAHGYARWGEPNFLIQALAIIAALLSVAGVFHLRLTRRAPALAFAFVGGGLAFHQRFVVDRPSGYPYGYFKAVTILAVLLAALLASGLAFLSLRPRLRMLSAILALTFLGVSSVHAAWTIRHSVTTQIVVSQELVAASESARRAAGRHPIEIDVSPGPKENWLGYLLNDAFVVFRRVNVIFPVTTPPLSETPKFVLEELSKTPQAVHESDGRSARRIWSGGGFEVRKILDSFLAEWPGTSMKWPEGFDLRVTKGTGGAPFMLNLNGQAWTGPLPHGQPRTVQLLFSTTSSARLVGSGEVLDVTPGTWLLDIDFSCAMPLQISLEAGALTLGATRLLGDATGLPGRCVELLPSQQGFLTWRPHLDKTKLLIDADFVPPARSEPHLHRLGLHVGGGLPGRHDWFGVWSIDFPADGRAHRAFMEVDLQSRKGRAELDGTRSDLLQTNQDVSTGKFDVTLALWRLDPTAQLYVENNFVFETAPVTGLHIVTSPHDVQYWWRSP